MKYRIIKKFDNNWQDGKYEIEGIENSVFPRTFLGIKLKPKTTSYLKFLSDDGRIRHYLQIPHVVEKTS